MKSGINIWSFVDQVDLAGCMRQARDAGFDGIELAYAAQGPIGPDATPADMRGIAATAAEIGIEISSLASVIFWQYNLVSEDEAEREIGKGHARKALELAGALGVDTVLVIPGYTGPFQSGPPAVSDYGVAYQRALEAMRELGPVAEEHGVFVGVENVWNRFLGSPIEMRDFIDRVDHPYVGSYFDVGNVLRSGYPEHWIRVLGTRIKKVHFKDYRIDVGTLDGFVELLGGDVNFPAVLDALEDVGYDDWCVAEIGARKLWSETTIAATARAMDVILAGRRG